MVGWMDDWMQGLVTVCIGCLLVVAGAYGRLGHARGPLPIGLRGFTPRQRPSRSTTNKQQTHTFNQPCIQSSIQPYTYPHINSPTHPLIHPTTHPPIHSSTHPFIHLSTHTSILSMQPSIPSTHMQRITCI